MTRSLLFLLLCVAWLAGPPASHAQSPDALKALGDLALEDSDKREAAVAALGGTRDPKWLEFLTALRDGNVYARGKGATREIVVGGVKTTKGDQDVIDIATAYDRKPLGTVPVSSLTEIAADRRLRIAIKPFLDADETRVQLASPDSEAVMLTLSTKPPLRVISINFLGAASHDMLFTMVITASSNDFRVAT